MKQNLYQKSALFLSSVVLSGAVFSASVDKDELANECKNLGTSLSQLAKANTKEHCSVDMNYSGLMMEQTASLIKVSRIQFALNNLYLVHRTLDRVSSNSWDCKYFSSRVSPYIEKAEQLIHQLQRVPDNLSKQTKGERNGFKCSN